MPEVRNYIITRVEEEIEQFKENEEIIPYNVKMIITFTQDLIVNIREEEERIAKEAAKKKTTTTKKKTTTTKKKEGESDGK